MAQDPRPLVAHVVHRFDTGGLENGVVNLINQMTAYRHVVVALTEVTAFRQRLRRDDVDCVALHKPRGHGARLYPQFARLMHQLQPAVLHTRNLGPLEMQVAAAWARVPVRIHGEHGRELDDPDGQRRKYQWLRRLYAPLVHRQVALSQDLQRYLVQRCGLAAERVVQIYNGVDATRFAPASHGPVPLAGSPFGAAAPSAPGMPGASPLCVVGTVGRMQGVKNQTLLAQAFVRALAMAPALRPVLRLVMVGDGPLRDASQQILQAAGVADLAWLPGGRDDVADVMRSLSCFVLPSLGEGISNTILEAMASGLPVVATEVGGNPELVQAGHTGWLVPSGDVEAMAQAMCRVASDPAQAMAMGRAGRAEVERRFSLSAMVGAYQDLYDRHLAAAGHGKGNG